MRYSDDMPIGAMTIGDLRTLINEIIVANKPVEKEPTGRLVYGLRGIANLFNVSHKTAQIYKDTFLQPAVKQYGRKIVCDADKALELFDCHKNL